ncbi:MAG: ornithine cyclodeaminase family protein [Firmicutes bacterium]|nr:ornithine cyclodeaminase family protein [Bacillota bacterium]
MKTLLLSKEEVAKLITLEDTIAAVEEGYRDFSSGKVIQPGYMDIHMPEGTGEIDFKACYCGSFETVSMKASSGGFTDNVEKYGLPSGMGTILLFDARSCALLCAMDGSLITGYRTGSAGAISVKMMAREDAGIITSIGTGNQARMQIRAISKVHKIKEIHAWDKFSKAAEKFKNDIESELKIPVIVEQCEQEAVSKADIIVTTTRGKGNVIDSSWVKKGAHIVAVGTDQKGKQEFDPKVFKNAKIVVDSIAQCVEKGETQHPIEEGIITKDDIYAEIGELLLGTKDGHGNGDEITIFDTTGMAVQDNVTAFKVYQNAVKNNIGTYFEFFK